MSDKPQLHVSMLDMLSRCGIQFQRRYGARFGIWDTEEIIPPGVALGIGISVHKSVEQNLRAKMEQGRLLEVAAVQAIADEEFRRIWEGGMLLSENEAVDQKKTLGEAVDMSVKLAGLHHNEFAPAVDPVAIEEKFVIVLDGFPFDIAGQKDIVEENRIGDVKTMGKNSPSVKSMQMATYSLDYRVKHGHFPATVYHQKLIKTKMPSAVLEEAKPDDTWVNPLLRRIERFAEIIDAVRSGRQAMTPADTNSWICSRRYCGWHQSCPFFSGKD